MADHNGAHTGGTAEEWDVRVPGRTPVVSRVVADPGGTLLLSEGHPAVPPPKRPERHRGRWILPGAIVIAILAVGLYWGVPWARYHLDTVSTDDAFVQGHGSSRSCRSPSCPWCC